MKEEISQIPDSIRMAMVQPFLSLARNNVTIDPTIINRMYEIRNMGITTFDAFHISCAEKVQAILLTTDDGILHSYKKDNTRFHIRILNPVQLLEQEY